jgi:hypothetical protein
VAMCWPRSACCRRKPKTLAITVNGQASAWRHRQGPDPAHHRRDRRQRRHRACHRISAARPFARCRWMRA